MVDYISQDYLDRLDEKHGGGYSLDIVETLRSFKVQKRSCKVDNYIIIRSQERLAKAQENKQRLMQLSFTIFQTCRDMDCLGSIMDKRTILMQPMVASLMVVIGQINMTWLEIPGYWIHLIVEAVDMGFTLVMVQTDTMVIITIILTGGVTGDIYQMSSRKKNHLHLTKK